MGHRVPIGVIRIDPTGRGRLGNTFLRWLEIDGHPKAKQLEVEIWTRWLRDYVALALLHDVVERLRGEQLSPDFAPRCDTLWAMRPATLYERQTVAGSASLSENLTIRRVTCKSRPTDATQDQK